MVGWLVVLPRYDEAVDRAVTDANVTIEEVTSPRAAPPKRSKSEKPAQKTVWKPSAKTAPSAVPRASPPARSFDATAAVS